MELRCELQPLPRDSWLRSWLAEPQCADRGGPLLLTRLAQQASIGVATRTTASLGVLSAAWYALFVPEVLRKRSE